MRIAKRNLSPFLPAVLMLLLAAGAGGCRGLVKEAFRTPRVEVADVALDFDPAADPKGPWRFLVTLSVDNRNPYPLTVASLAYSGMIGTEVVAEGERTEDARIEPSGVTTVRVPVVLRPSSLQAAARQVLSRKAVSWEFNGSAGLRTPFVGVVRVPFSKSGSYDAAYFLKRLGIGLK